MNPEPISPDENEPDELYDHITRIVEELKKPNPDLDTIKRLIEEAPPDPHDRFTDDPKYSISQRYISTLTEEELKEYRKREAELGVERLKRNKAWEEELRQRRLARRAEALKQKDENSDES